jgi:transposase
MRRGDGRASSGERVIARGPRNYGPNVTRVGALDARGLHAVMPADGATDPDILRTYVTRALGPTLAPAEMVVMDHRRAHKAVGSQQAMTRRGARRLYLPPYSPDLSPIEGVLATITEADAHRWFRHWGYALR